MEVSRRGLFSFIAGATAGVVAGAIPTDAVQPPTLPAAGGPGSVMRAALRELLGEDIFTSWFHALEFERVDGPIVTVSVPVKFLGKWIMSHYYKDLVACCRQEFETVQHVKIVLRQPGTARPFTDPFESEWQLTKVRWFNDVRGFGFLGDNRSGVTTFVNRQTVRRSGFKTLRTGEWVRMRSRLGSRGWMATELRPV